MASLIGFPIDPRKQSLQKSAVSRHLEITRATNNIGSSKIMEDYDKYFNCKWKFWKIMMNIKSSKNVIFWGIKSQTNKNKNYLAKVYKNITSKKQIKVIIEQYIVVTNNCLLLYEGIFYSKKYSMIIIVMEILSNNLENKILSYTNKLLNQSNNRQIYKQKELFIKQISINILDKLWIIHNNNYVHTQIIPKHIMLRDCNKWQNELNNKHKIIKNGWKIIGFDNIIANNGNKMKYNNNTLGWSSPEIDPVKYNKYTFAADIWSFGLIILYLLLGYQPFQLSKSQYKSINKKRKNNKIIIKEWYSNKLHMHQNGQLYLTQYLETLYSKEILSNELFTLLCAGMLRFNKDARWSCKQISNCMWFNNINNVNNNRNNNNNNNNNSSSTGNSSTTGDNDVSSDNNDNDNSNNNNDKSNNINNKNV